MTVLYLWRRKSKLRPELCAVLLSKAIYTSDVGFTEFVFKNQNLHDSDDRNIYLESFIYALVKYM